MLRNVLFLVPVTLSLSARALGQAIAGPPAFVPPLPSALNTPLTSSVVFHSTPIDAPTFPIFPYETAGQSLASSASGASTSSENQQTLTAALNALTSSVPFPSSVEQSVPATITIAVLAPPLVTTVVSNFTGPLNSTSPMSLSNNTALVLPSRSLNLTVASVTSREVTPLSEIVTPTGVDSSNVISDAFVSPGSSLNTVTLTASSSLVVPNQTPVQLTAQTDSDGSPVSVVTVFSSPADSSQNTPLASFPAEKTGSSVTLDVIVLTATSTGVVPSETLTGSVAASEVPTAPPASLPASQSALPLTTSLPDHCTAMVYVTETVTIFETATQCPIVPTSAVSAISAPALTTGLPWAGPQLPSAPKGEAPAAASVAWQGSTSTCTSTASDSSGSCVPGPSKLFGPIVVDVVAEARPSTFSTVTVFTTSGFITVPASLVATSGTSSSLPASCSNSSSGEIVCSGCPAALLGVDCGYVCNVVGSPRSASYCEQSDMTGEVAADQGVMECVPCSSVSSTVTFAPTEPIVKGVTGAPAATVTFTQTPSLLVGSGTPGGPSKPDFLSPATEPTSAGVLSMGPETYGSPSVETSALSEQASFTLVALTSPEVPQMDTAIITSSMGSTVLIVGSTTVPVPASVIVTTLPHIGAGMGTATVSSQEVAASSVPRSPQATTTAADAGAGGSSCTSVAAGAKPSPAYTDKQNGMLYRIQCGTTLDLVQQCPYLCSEGGGGLFRQCEDNDQSGPAPTPGGVGIVCQKCLPPC